MMNVKIFAVYKVIEREAENVVVVVMRKNYTVYLLQTKQIRLRASNYRNDRINDQPSKLLVGPKL
jgi:hypothetical protein